MLLINEFTTKLLDGIPGGILPEILGRTPGVIFRASFRRTTCATFGTSIDVFGGISRGSSGGTRRGILGETFAVVSGETARGLSGGKKFLVKLLKKTPVGFPLRVSWAQQVTSATS